MVLFPKAAGVGPVGAADVLKLLDGFHYQIACKKFFDLTHPGNKVEETGIIHPNSYFVESISYWKEKNGNKEEDKDKDKPAVAGRSKLLNN